MTRAPLPPALVPVALALALGAGWFAVAGGPRADDRAPRPVSILEIRGIEGIDHVALRNLEAVLQMQSRPTESSPRGTTRAAAELLTSEPPAGETTGPAPDARQELEFQMEGS